MVSRSSRIAGARAEIASLAVVALLCASCAGRGRDPARASTSASPRPAGPAPVAVMGGGPAPGLTPAPAGEYTPPEPTVDYASLEQARDAVERVVRHSVDPKNPGVSVHRDTVTFQYWYAHAAAHGWIFRVEVQDTSVCPIETIEDAMQNAGWAQAYGYQADGPDGGDLGFVTRRFLCLIQGQWDGGDDSDTTYVPAPGCKVTATIVPRRADDVMR